MTSACCLHSSVTQSSVFMYVCMYIYICGILNVTCKTRVDVRLGKEPVVQLGRLRGWLTCHRSWHRFPLRHAFAFSVVLLLLLLLLSLTYHRVFVPWYASGASGVPHRSGFRFQTLELSLLYVMFPVQLILQRIYGMVSWYYFQIFF
jgi:hypothetical protein